MEIIRQQESLELSNKDRDAFLAALENPPAPNNEVKEAFSDYKRLVKRR